MSAEQHDADAYGQELARIGQHQHEATNARFVGLQALAAIGSRDRAGGQDRVAAGGRGNRLSAHLDLPERRFADGWFAGVRAVASNLLRVDDTTTAQRGRSASGALLLAHLHQPAPPCPRRLA
ncbi:hypothetical protein [Streptomyces sp. NPDC055749]